MLVPHGTSTAAPLTVNIGFPSRLVTRVSYRVPPGPSGLMGWALTSAGAPVIPIQPKTFIITDNQAATWDLEGYLDSGNWQVTAYNNGVYDHSVYLTFELDMPGAAEIPAPPPPGSGAGVIGIGGSVPPPSSPPPSPPPPTPPPGDAAGAATPVILAALTAMLQAAAGPPGGGNP